MKSLQSRASIDASGEAECLLQGWGAGPISREPFRLREVF